MEYLWFLSFQVSRFNKSNFHDFIENDLPQLTRLQSTGLSGLGTMLEF